MGASTLVGWIGNAVTVTLQGGVVFQSPWRPPAAGLVPDLEEAVPGPCRHSHPVVSHPQAADAVVMPSQDTCPVGFERVPDVAVEVVVACEEQAPTLGERHGSDPAYDIVVGVGHELLVRTEVKQSAGGVVRAGGKRIAIWKETDGVDVRLVASEGLPTHPFSHVPEFG